MRTVEHQISQLCKELDEVERMSEAEVCTAYNVDSKEWIVQLIREELQQAEEELECLEQALQAQTNYCRTADNPYLAW